MKMKNKIVYIERATPLYRSLFTDAGMITTHAPANADLVVFTGGSDVNPRLYGEPPHSKTHFDLDRDNQEVILFQACEKWGIPMVGICRGGQFLHVMNGGSLYQEVNNHTTSHLANIEISEDKLELPKQILVSSTHHQMMKLQKNKGELIMTARESGRRESMNPSGTSSICSIGVGHQDVEAIYYDDTRSLCFQPHPEYDIGGQGELRMVFLKLVSFYLL